MKNIVYDFFMGIICILLVVTIVGLIVLPDALEVWAKGRGL